MKKITSLLMFVIVIAALTGILAFLYGKSQNINSESYNRINTNLRSLKQVDAEWDVNVLRTKVGSNQHYDSLTSPQKFIRELQDSIAMLTEKLDQNTNILPIVNKLQQAIENKMNLIEDFKSQHAVLKNSLSFLPTAVDDLQTEIDLELAKLNTAKTHEGSLRALQTPLSVPLLDDLKNKINQLQTLRTQSRELLVELLKYNLARDETLKPHIEKLIASLGNAAIGHEDKLAGAVAVLQAHSRTVVERRDAGSDILTGLDEIPTTSLNDELSHQVSENFGQRLTEQNQYRRYLVIYAGALLALLIYAAYRLLKAFRELTSANENLEQHVVARTSDLNQALSHLQESQAQLVQSEKMASLGQMVAGITHEINTPLAYVKSGLEITSMRLGEISELVTATDVLNHTLADQNATDEQVHKDLQQVSELSGALAENETMSETEGLLKDGIHGMDQISEIITSLKNFSRMDRAKVAAFDVNEGLESTLKIANNIVKHKSVLKNYGEVRSLTCSPSSINQVFLNLITNAAQATGDDGEIRLTTVQLEDAIKIEVRDNGNGISVDALEKIFDPFFTTKEIGQGTGLGLSIVQRIITEHGGTITVDSTEGVGTCFTVIFPHNAIQKG